MEEGSSVALLSLFMALQNTFCLRTAFAGAIGTTYRILLTVLTGAAVVFG